MMLVELFQLRQATRETLLRYDRWVGAHVISMPCVFAFVASLTTRRPGRETSAQEAAAATLQHLVVCSGMGVSEAEVSLDDEARVWPGAGVCVCVAVASCRSWRAASAGPRIS